MRNCEMLDPQSTEAMVEELLAEVAPSGCERRRHARSTFLAPVTVVRVQDGRCHEMSCLSRDISSGGIGLLHNAPLEIGPAVVKVPRRNGDVMQLPCEVVWCHACGEGWYVAGAAFVFEEHAT